MEREEDSAIVGFVRFKIHGPAGDGKEGTNGPGPAFPPSASTKGSIESMESPVFETDSLGNYACRIARVSRCRQDVLGS